MSALPPCVSWDFEAIGVPWRVDTAAAVDEADRHRILTVMREFDRDWSRFRDDSSVARLAAGEGAVRAPRDTLAMLDTLAAAADATGDAVTPLAGDALQAIGYDAALTLRAGPPRPAPGWREVLSWSEDRIELARPAVLDVGSLGKGRLVDLVFAELSGLRGPVAVDGSGDLRTRGVTERIGLEHPYDRHRVVGVWEIRDAALCASATNRRAWGDGLHHVIDGRTGRPVDTVVATWAVGEDAMHADAVATALFFDGGPRLAHEWGVQWVRMTSDGRVDYSPGCTAQLYTR
ncbi:FAD:protein FMN transferase [Microbacterium xanthum]|uniref:FAD:protein FMN transferase n=1 Tax=Microbacterium xanthum TaxID=3079794 RepID=UPI002AD59840|nr:FAD:protein FMN transferase [Microbacterium sp. KSW-48]MDZ8172033.1 FAD:protein FMN transferase [Microbacterium sp. KSW-48]